MLDCLGDSASLNRIRVVGFLQKGTTDDRLTFGIIDESGKRRPARARATRIGGARSHRKPRHFSYCPPVEVDAPPPPPLPPPPTPPGAKPPGATKAFTLSLR